MATAPFKLSLLDLLLFWGHAVAAFGSLFQRAFRCTLQPCLWLDILGLSYCLVQDFAHPVQVCWGCTLAGEGSACTVVTWFLVCPSSALAASLVLGWSSLLRTLL